MVRRGARRRARSWGSPPSDTSARQDEPAALAQRSAEKRSATAPCPSSIHPCERERSRELARSYRGIPPRLANDMATSSARKTALVTGAAGFVGSHLVD